MKASTGGCMAGGVQESVAREQAKAVGGQNAIIGEPTVIEDGDFSFRYPNPQEPQIRVIVCRSQEWGNAVATIFARVLHVFQVDVSATATAEAHNGGVPNSCIAPFRVPNCDPVHTSPSNTALCGNAAGPFVYADTHEIVRDAPYPVGVVGERWELHFGSGPSDSAVPSQWYMLAMDASQSAAELRNFITRCYPKPISCGDMLETYDGKTVGPINQGVIARIHADGEGMNRGQDSIDTTKDPSVWITGGYNNANFNGVAIQGHSDSMVTVPIHDGQPLVPGGEGWKRGARRNTSAMISVNRCSRCRYPMKSIHRQVAIV